MLAILSAVERELPALLQDEAAWKGLHVDYHPPTVERLWRERTRPQGWRANAIHAVYRGQFPREPGPLDRRHPQGG